MVKDMTCHNHSDRESNGQCENCKANLCPECISKSRKNAENVMLCHNCITDAHEKRKSAKADIRIFTIGAITGGVTMSLLPLILGILTLPDGAQSSAGILSLIAIFGVIGLISTYMGGTGCLGIRKAFATDVWQQTKIDYDFAKTDGIDYARDFAYYMGVALYVVGGFLIGLIKSPFDLRKDRKLLRETTWIETLITDKK
ncbi:MAG: hypothetical protein FWD52_04105 [Candidatus Bathyarchaeota archaeon]|nr:hypothetical protein [Candidatus Termiticorpusculum sp.]